MSEQGDGEMVELIVLPTHSVIKHYDAEGRRVVQVEKVAHGSNG